MTRTWQAVSSMILPLEVRENAARAQRILKEPGRHTLIWRNQPQKILPWKNRVAVAQPKIGDWNRTVSILRELLPQGIGKRRL